MFDTRPQLPEDCLFESRNAFLDMLLGLISLSERSVATLVELAAPLPVPPQGPDRPDRAESPLLR
jgi:hypothetical protein